MLTKLIIRYGALLLLGGLVLCGTAVAAGQIMHGDMLAFVLHREEDFDYGYAKGAIMLVDVRTEISTYLTTHQTTEDGLAWSPDGHWLAFSSDQHNGARGVSSVGMLIYLMDVETQAIDRLIERNMQDSIGRDIEPIWSPDSQTLLLLSNINEFPGLNFKPNLVQMDDRSVVRLADAATLTEFAPPQWSPDGTQIAFVGRGKTYANDIFVLDVASGTVRQIVPDDALERTALINPAWSPDGESIAFVALNREGGHLYITEGDSLRMLADYTVNRSLNISEALAWSPDGTQIAYSSVANGQHDIYLVDVTSGTTHNLTTELSGLAHSPVWHNGRIAFLLDYQPGRMRYSKLYVMNADGSHLRQISTLDQTFIRTLSWRP